MGPSASSKLSNKRPGGNVLNINARLFEWD